jgi:hypothetical protein
MISGPSEEDGAERRTTTCGRPRLRPAMENVELCIRNLGLSRGPESVVTSGGVTPTQAAETRRLPSLRQHAPAHSRQSVREVTNPPLGTALVLLYSDHFDGSRSTADIEFLTPSGSPPFAVPGRGQASGREPCEKPAAGYRVAAMSTKLHSHPIRNGHDVVAVREQDREPATLFGFDAGAQPRIATAISPVAILTSGFPAPGVRDIPMASSATEVSKRALLPPDAGQPMREALEGRPARFAAPPPAD